MATYTYNSSTTTRKSNASAEDFTFDISSAITAANIPAYAKITKVTINVWGDIDTATSRGKMTAYFGSTNLCSSIWAGGSAGEVSSGAKEITSYFNSENANAGKLKDSLVRLNVTLDGPVMISKFNHTVRYQVYFEWTTHSHSWNSGVVTKSATCLATGTKTYACATCNAKKTETIAQLPHSYTGEVKIVSGGKTGTHAYKCVNGCDNYGGAVNHTFEYDRTIEATCTEEGENRYDCSECGHMYAETIPALGHSFESTVSAKSPTCTTAGNSAYKKCSRCGLYFSGDASTTATGGKSDTSSFVIPAKGHTQVTIPAVAPTCESTGLTEGKKCSVCGTIITAQQTVAKLGHNYVGVTTKEPTCTEKGIKTYTCQNDASHKYTEDIPALGHSWGATSYNRAKDYSACTAKRTCSTCGTEETALATMTTEVKTAPTCTTKGVTTHIALFDVPWAVRYAWNVEDIPELGHNYTSVVTEPTSTTNGYTTHTCSRCGDSKVDSYTCKVTVSCDTAMGAVTGGGVYSQNGTATLTATPKTGYKFVKWSDGNTNASRTFTVENSVTYTAIFEKLSPKFTTVEMTYLNKQISASNKVPCREGFIISAKVT